MAIATVGCPKCRQAFRSTDVVKGTKIGCPLCGFAFVVQKFVKDKDEPPAKDKEKEKAKAKAEEEDEDKEDPNPLGMRNISLAARCPNCANEMEDEHAIICLYCGYNTQTRAMGATKVVASQTGGDKFKWLMPGVACLLLCFTLILLQNIYILWWGMDARGKDGMIVNALYCEPVYFWLTIITIGIMWAVGRFAFNRLIVEPTPPEEDVK